MSNEKNQNPKTNKQTKNSLKDPLKVIPMHLNYINASLICILIEYYLIRSVPTNPI